MKSWQKNVHVAATRNVSSCLAEGTIAHYMRDIEVERLDFKGAEAPPRSFSTSNSCGSVSWT